MVNNTPFRLLIVGVSWPPETFLVRLINGLAKSGIDVTVVGERPTGENPLALSVRWTPLHKWEGSRIARLIRFAHMWMRARVLAQRDLRLFQTYTNTRSTQAERLPCLYSLLPFAGKRWDAIYFPWNSAAIAYLPLFDLGCPVIISCRGAQLSIAPHNPERENIRTGLRETLSRAQRVHCVSEAIQQEARLLGMDMNRCHIIRPAVDPEVFCPGTREPNAQQRLHIVSTGSIIWRKGYEYGLLAIRMLVSSGFQIQYDIIGDGEDRQRLLYTIHDLGLENHVQVLGRLAPQEVVRQLQQADVFLLSSLSEGISNAVLEAMSCGLPVVTTDCGGMREAVTDGVEGFVVRVRDAEAMAEALAQLAGSPELRKTMGQAARKRILCEFTLERQICQWHELLQSLNA